MSDLTMFIVAMILVVVLWGAYALRDVDKIEYFKTSDGLGILKGVVLAILFAVVLGVGSKAFAGEWLTEGVVYAGIDHTFDTSPQCVRGGVDDQATSNLGVRVTLYEEGSFSLNTKYTHHSCAFGVDDDGYDAVGIELVYKLW